MREHPEKKSSLELWYKSSILGKKRNQAVLISLSAEGQFLNFIIDVRKRTFENCIHKFCSITTSTHCSSDCFDVIIRLKNRDIL